MGTPQASDSSSRRTIPPLNLQKMNAIEDNLMAPLHAVASVDSLEPSELEALGIPMTPHDHRDSMDMDALINDEGEVTL